jgi:glycosyltransferase involved in cell wall biosynthesis
MNNKFTIIIPTLWKSERIHKLLNDLINCETIGEIILIDNSNQFKEYYNELLKKTKIIIPESNLFVSGSWNLGIRSAQYENICLCSDDINFDPNIFKMLLEYNNIGIIGQASENYHKEYGSNPIITPLTGIRPWGWGCLIFLKKEYWYNVPEQLKVWYGDDWIVKFNPITKYTLHHFSIKTEMSTTSDLSNFNEIKNQDRIFWETLQ